jgi:alkane 1-monooxygenase
LPFAFLATAPAGAALGGAWTFLTVAATPAALLGLDRILGEDGPASSEARGWAFGAIPPLYIACQLAFTIFAVARASVPGASILTLTGLTLSAGLTAGVFGILAAHELIHKPSRGARVIGLIMLASVLYMHFRLAHIFGHHRRAATREDAASARSGEGFYRFLLRSVGGQVRESLAFEHERLRRRGSAGLHPANRLLHYLALQLALLLGIASLGLRPLAVFVGQAAAAVVMLELFNYVAHYGLVRRRTAAGLERLGPQHSWNVSRRMNNWSLFNMGRHGDHHRRPAADYQRLGPEPYAPELPGGYAGAVLMALAPPLWRRIMDPRVQIWARATDEPGSLRRAFEAQERLRRAPGSGSRPGSHRGEREERTVETRP